MQLVINIALSSFSYVTSSYRDFSACAVYFLTFLAFSLFSVLTSPACFMPVIGLAAFGLNALFVN